MHEPNQQNFLRMGYLFEGGLVGIAYLLGWAADLDPFADFSFTGTAISYGMLATLPLLLLFFWSYQQPHPALHRIKRFLLDNLAPQLAVCRWYDLLGLSIVAGVGEEALFRGILQPWAEGHWGWAAGLIISSVLFGLVHFVTPLYGLLALLTSVYLGLMLDVGEQRNLLTPTVTHALYDFVAFWAVIQTYRAEQAGKAL